ncbi:hypothetical protein CRYUN_Cryun03dG0098700 [Craigia yunnanensis]
MMPGLLTDVTGLTLFWKLFTVVPILVTAYICPYNVHSTDNELEDSTQVRPVVRTALALCLTIYIMTIFYEFLLFGDATLDDLLANFYTDLFIPYSSLLNDAFYVSYAAYLMLVFLIFYPLQFNMDDLSSSTRPLALSSPMFDFITAGLITIFFLGANFIPASGMLSNLLEQLLPICLEFLTCPIY